MISLYLTVPERRLCGDSVNVFSHGVMEETFSFGLTRSSTVPLLLGVDGALRLTSS